MACDLKGNHRNFFISEVAKEVKKEAKEEVKAVVEPKVVEEVVEEAPIKRIFSKKFKR